MECLILVTGLNGLFIICSLLVMNCMVKFYKSFLLFSVMAGAHLFELLDGKGYRRRAKLGNLPLKNKLIVDVGGGVASVLAYDVPVGLNGRRVDYRSYFTRFSQFTLVRVLNKGVRMDILSDEDAKKFSKRWPGKKEVFLRDRKLSDYLYESAADYFSYIDHPSFCEEGAAKKYSEFRSHSFFECDADWRFVDFDDGVTRRKVRSGLGFREREIFLGYNYLRKILRGYIDAFPTDKERSFSRIENLRERVGEFENVIASANMPLVLSTLKRKGFADIAPGSLLIGDGNLSLLNAIKGFDVSRGLKFSTYASSAILKSAVRFIGKRKTHDGRYRQKAIPDRPDDGEVADSDYELALEVVRRVMQDNEALPERTWKILHSRVVDKKTLREVAVEHDLSRDRIRQLQKEGLIKLRRIVSERL